MNDSPDPDDDALPLVGSDTGAELRKLRRRLRRVERELKAREQEIATLRESHSFRLTAPLRWLRRQLAGGADGIEAATNKRALSGKVSGLAVAELPPGLVACQDVPVDPNDSHRPLGLDDAIQPLVRVPVVGGELRDGLPPGATRYYGKRIAPLRLATIACRELREELAFDAAVTPLQSQGWEGQLAGGSHDLLLIEGAWEPEGNWGAGFAGTPASQTRLQQVLERCRDLALPVVLWAREDVGGLERLAWLTGRVNRAYAVDVRGERWLQRNLPEIKCGLLPVAVQPALHNPVRSYALRDCEAVLSDKVLLDGWWDLASGQSEHPIAAAFGDRLRVVEGQGDYSWTRLPDVGRYAPLALGSVTPLEKAALMRNMAAGLFLPAALAKPWRQAHGMLQAAACGAAVFWGGDESAPWSPAQRVRPDSAMQALDGLVADRLGAAKAAHLGFRQVMSGHSIADRLARITQDLGLARAVVDPPARVAHLLVTMRPSLLDACLGRFRADRYPNRELVLVLHGDDIDIAAARALVGAGEPVTLLHATGDRSLGDCLNMAIAHTDAPYWMKIDDDDQYGPAYTSDMMLYCKAIDAPVMGKPPMFLQLEQGDELRWDPARAPHANVLHPADQAEGVHVAGGTLGGKREVLESVGFSGARRGGSDSDFVQRCFDQGHDLLAVDGFNFARFRSARTGAHTWKVADEELRSRTSLIGDGESLASQVFI